MVFGLSRCQEQSIPEIKAEIVDISSLDVKDLPAASPDNKVLPPTMTARPYPLHLNRPLPIPALVASTVPKETSDTVKFAVTIPPAKKDPLAENNFKTPHRPAKPVVLTLEHVTIKTPTRVPFSGSSSYGHMKEGEESI
jgi:hypothetical protein